MAENKNKTKQPSFALIEFRNGFMINLNGIKKYQNEIFHSKWLKSLLISLVIFIIALFLITFPLKILLYCMQKFLSIFSNSLSKSILKTRNHLSWLNLIIDSLWYLPLIMLSISKLLQLFGEEPFVTNLKSKTYELLFSKHLLNAKQKQPYWSTLLRVLEHTFKVFMLSIALHLIRFVPYIRFIIAVLLVLYVVYQKIMDNKYQTTKDHKPKNMYHLNWIRLTFIAFAVSMFLSDYIAEGILYFGKLYLTSKSMSRYFLSPYFEKITFEKEERDEENNKFLLFGFGILIVVIFSIPFLGLILFPVFYASAADLLIEMKQTHGLTFDEEGKQQ